MPSLKNYRRSVKFINRDFAESRLQLINYAKTYFPNSYSDFNESSVGTMMIEMASVVSDVANFYSDVNLQESMLYTADERINLYNLAQSHGYKPKTIVPASVELDIFQLVPSVGEGVNTKPDFRYALQVKENMQVSTDDKNPVYFRTLDAVDFRFSSSYDPTTTSVYSVTNDGAIEYYLLKKTVKAVAGELKTATYSFAEPKIYDKIVVQDDNVVDVIDVFDADGNQWYEVPYMAQDLVPISKRNVPSNDTLLAQYRDSVPSILCYKQTERRFVTRVRKDDRYEIQFGAGLSSESDEEILPNPFNVGLGLPYFERVTDVSIDPMNFLYTRTYGSSPSNTVLTVRYSVADGLNGNVNSNTITRIDTIEFEPMTDIVDSTILTTIQNSVTITNPYAAFGGQNKKPLDTVREEAIANFAAQNRAVTKEDYILRCYTLPAKYGSIAKAYIEQDYQTSKWNSDKIENPLALNLYITSLDANNNFVNCNRAIKENLKNYLKQYRLLTDALNIKNLFIVNIGVQIDILSYPDQNSNEVITRCLEKLMEIFDNSRMQPATPIIISNITSQLDRVDGVQSVLSVKFTNLIDSAQGYSNIVYDVNNAIRNNILYPSIDPMIFEVKFPYRDLQVRISDQD